MAVNFQIDSPEIEVALLGTQDKYVALLEEGMNVSINPLAISCGSRGTPRTFT